MGVCQPLSNYNDKYCTKEVCCFMIPKPEHEKENVNLKLLETKTSILIQQNTLQVVNETETSQTKELKIKRVVSDKSHRKYASLLSFQRFVSCEAYLKKQSENILANKSILAKQPKNSIKIIKGSEQINLDLNKKQNNEIQKLRKEPTCDNCNQKTQGLTVIPENENEGVEKLNNITYQTILNSPENIAFDNNLYNLLTLSTFLKANFKEAHLKCLTQFISEYEINEDVNIFNKNESSNCIFMLEEGKLKFYDKENEENVEDEDNYMIIEAPFVFGEICLISKEEIKRRYTAKILNKIKFCILNKKDVFEKMDSEDIELKTINFHILKSIQLIKNLKDEEIKELGYFSILVDEAELEDYKYVNMQEFFLINLIIFYINDTYLLLDIPPSRDSDVTENINIEDKNFKKQEKKYILISIQGLLEVLGPLYKKKILYSIFTNYITNNNNFNSFFDINQLQIAYSVFKIKSINNENSRKIKIKKDKTFFIFLLSGNLSIIEPIQDKEASTENENIINTNSKAKLRTFHPISFIDTSNFNNSSKLVFDLKSIILYSSYQNLKKKSDEIKEQYLNILSTFTKFEIFNNLSDDEIIKLSHLMEKKQYKKNEIIYSTDYQCEFFYLVDKGTVRISDKNDMDRIRRKYSEGNCFGETFLLEDDGQYSEELVIEAEVNCDLYVIKKADFYNLVRNPKINNYIKYKMCIEDKSIELSDLYYLSFLGKGKFSNVYLVHNGISLYAIKACSIIEIEKFKGGHKLLINEADILRSLNFRFIIKLVKTFKYKEWCLFLMEYPSRFNLEEVIKRNITKYNIEATKFYAGCLFLIENYLNDNYILHRDIKPNNIVLDNDGYIKLLDFGASKKVNDNKLYTQTTIGTPFYIPPEVLDGQNYSISCDYFSIGVCLYYLYYNRYPFGEGQKDVYGIYNDIKNKKINFDSCINSNPSLNKLIKALLNKDPILRCSKFEDIKNFSIFNDFDWKLLYSKKIKAPFIPKENEGFEDKLTNFNTPFLKIIDNESKTNDNIKIHMAQAHNKKKLYDDF